MILLMEAGVHGLVRVLLGENHAGSGIHQDELLRLGVDRCGRPKLQRGGEGTAQTEAQGAIEGGETGTPAHGGSIGHLVPAPPHPIRARAKVYTLAGGRAKHLSLAIPRSDDVRTGEPCAIELGQDELRLVVRVYRADAHRVDHAAVAPFRLHRDGAERAHPFAQKVGLVAPAEDCRLDQEPP